MDLRQYFTKDNLIKRLQELPVLKTPLMDSLFTERPQNPSALVSISDVLETAKEIPLVMRGAPSLSAKDRSGSIQFIEPLALKQNRTIGAVEMNNLKLMTNESLDLWASQRTDAIRKDFRMTTEALCAQALSGTIAWPVQIENGGYTSYDLVYGTPLSVTADAMIDESGVGVAEVHEILTDMKEAIEAKGFGGEVEVQAASDVYSQLYRIAEDTTSTAKMIVEVGEDYIMMGGFRIVRRATTYTNPETGTVTPIVPAKFFRMVAKDGGQKLIYSAVDDLDANLAPLPFFVKPIKTQDPDGWKLVGQSKPLPVVNTDSICTCQVMTDD